MAFFVEIQRCHLLIEQLPFIMLCSYLLWYAPLSLDLGYNHFFLDVNDVYCAKGLQES